MKPTKDSEHALVDVLDVLMREGAMIQADVLVTVADVPLVGINLRAAVAGLTTMREYGLFENWDIEKRGIDEDRRRELGRRPDPGLPQERAESGASSDE
ncbi:gas vesicle protein GvpM [Halobacteriales archaeon QS_6_71_20]|nr:MAG: gas vesicle protein GvpM [Halobacteriales archaeon QS_6_71_20]